MHRDLLKVEGDKWALISPLREASNPAWSTFTLTCTGPREAVCPESNGAPAPCRSGREGASEAPSLCASLDLLVRPPCRSCCSLAVRRSASRAPARSPRLPPPLARPPPRPRGARRW
ncbi:hypothetical protein DB31_3557 [Hyalangium minutum]|uniref:Uncharacterized protein n=1 Tax=Hyalangium minutum TaxID=394096 RepID=A0A085WUR4_9BACT|nr:hypothetical protein DB31_3557 [Hyalangium minutum]